MLEPVFRTPDDGYYFFGYYDKSALNASGDLLLAQRAGFMNRMPSDDDGIEIGYFEWSNNSRFRPLSETLAWNWQQGCMLQWLGPVFDRHIVYNDREDGRFVSVVLDILTGEKTILPIPIYAMHPTGRHALCVDFERLYWFRKGYNYQGIHNVEKRKAFDQDDGIWLLDIQKREVRQIINILDVLNLRPLSTMDGAVHYLEHLMFNGDGSRFCFLHRWELEDGGIYTRLFTADLDGQNLYLLHDTGRVSHFAWRNRAELIGYVGTQTALNLLRRRKWVVKFLVKPLLPFYHTLIGRESSIRQQVSGDRYILFSDLIDRKRQIGFDTLKKDGHPTFCPADDDWLLLDSYPNKEHMATLKLYCLSADKEIVVDELKSIQEFDDGPLRCDLHPRWSYDGRFVCVDTMHEGHRGMYLYDVSDIVGSR